MTGAGRPTPPATPGRGTRSRGPALLAAACLPLLAGCGSLFAFCHDKTIGPLSPAGRLHSLTAGSNFTASHAGMTATPPTSLWRPYPLDFLQRLARPQSFNFAVAGGQAFISAVSPIVVRDGLVGRRLDEEQEAALAPGLTARDVLEKVGPPRLWIRRKEGSIMAYRADHARSFSFYLGVPPGVADAIPGLNNLNLRYTTSWRTPYKTVLFFDGEDVLRWVTSNGDDAEAEVAPEPSPVAEAWR